mmetsp:Transcript_79572/g.221301  ORF Transcript_79572/g.221301 Transcript_79572/m.221301 type:complete len:200 (-) Transcript_79572:173-772(-)
MERVALPAPSLAATTSSPPNWMRCVRAATWSSLRRSKPGTRESSGRMVLPAWPPITSTAVSSGSWPSASPTKVRARTTSRVVTPKRRLGLYTPAALSVSATMGTVLFTGLEMMSRCALGQCLAAPAARALTMEALVLKRSSRVMPGLRGTPAGQTTMSAPDRASPSSSSPTWPVTLPRVLQWLTSAATPGVLTMSKRRR